jgi:polygalacturonase
MTTRARGFLIAVMASLVGVPACGQGAAHEPSDSDSDSNSADSASDSGSNPPIEDASDETKGGPGNDEGGGSDAQGVREASAKSDAAGTDSSTESDAAGQSAPDTGTGNPPPPGTCGAGDAKLPAEPTIPAACATLHATQNVAANGVPSESSLDTAAIQAALRSCTSGQAVKLTTGSGTNSFVTGPLSIPSNVSLWVDAGTTLFGTRSRSVYGSASALITVSGANSKIVGDGVIDGQGGEPIIGGSGSFWDQNGNGGSSPTLIQVSGATNFTLYDITLHNAPMFHVKLGAKGFVVWGITIKTPSKSTNSVGTALTVSSAHNTDGVDPGEAASNGYIVCNKISDGDDHIAIKGSSPTGVTNLTIAHNHFEAGHGMSIGSEFTGGVSGIDVYDLSIDGLGGTVENGIRIKSDSSRGGLVNDVTYSDVCVRGLSVPILLTPRYTTATGNEIPQYTNIRFANFHALNGPANQMVTLDGYDSSHLNSVTLDNVIVDGITAGRVAAQYTKVTLGPGNVNFIPSGTGVTVTDGIAGGSTPNTCAGKWVSF